MAMSDHLQRFRQKSSDELIALRTAYEAQETIFTAQAKGNTSMQRDLRLLAEKLNAIAAVLGERGSTVIQKSPADQSTGVVDFSDV